MPMPIPIPIPMPIPIPVPIPTPTPIPIPIPIPMTQGWPAPRQGAMHTPNLPIKIIPAEIIPIFNVI